MRDLRDPQKLGEALLEESDGVSGLSNFYEAVVRDYDIPDYPSHESMVTEQVARYQAELKERAEQGDKYAISLLQGDKSDDPSGN